jgi:hypothetical protein
MCGIATSQKVNKKSPGKLGMDRRPNGFLRKQWNACCLEKTSTEKKKVSASP